MFAELLEFYRSSLKRSNDELADYIGELPASFASNYSRNLSGLRLVG